MGLRPYYEKNIPNDAKYNFGIEVCKWSERK